MAFVQLLVAEDDRASLLLLSRLLGGWRYQVVPVTDRLKAWEVLQVPDAPRLAILDWMMPGMTVIEGMDSGADD